MGNNSQFYGFNGFSNFEDLFRNASNNGRFYYREIRPRRFSLIRFIIGIIIINFLINSCSVLFNPWYYYYDSSPSQPSYNESETRPS